MNTLFFTRMKTTFYVLLLFIIMCNNHLTNAGRDRNLIDWIFYGDEERENTNVHDENSEVIVYEEEKPSSSFSSYYSPHESSDPLPSVQSYSPPYQSSYLPPHQPSYSSPYQSSYSPPHQPSYSSSYQSSYSSAYEPSYSPPRVPSFSIPPHPAPPFHFNLSSLPIPFQSSFPMPRYPMPYNPHYGQYNATTPEDCKCGIFQHSRTRIVGGSTASHEEFPWLVKIRKYHGVTFVDAVIKNCVGAMITMLHILSAAHCFEKDYMYSEVILSDGKLYQVEKFEKHEDYVTDALPLKYDIAVGWLKYRIRLGYPVGPICLPLAYEVFVRKMAIVAGWGRTVEDKPSGNDLHKATIPILTENECHKSHYAYTIPDNMFCAGYMEGGPDTCKGDSGGPVAVKGDNNEFIAAGIVNFGEGCGKSGYPGLNTKVTSFIKWIKDKLGSEIICSRPSFTHNISF